MTTDGDEAYAMITAENPPWSEISTPVFFVFNQQVIGTVPLYRFRSNVTQDHFFTIYEAEGEEAITKYNCIAEAVCCYVSPTQLSGTIPFYRLLTDYGYHYYTTDAQERAVLIAKGWESEEMPMFVWTAQVARTIQ
jgi:hypothetical protein